MKRHLKALLWGALASSLIVLSVQAQENAAAREPDKTRHPRAVLSDQTPEATTRIAADAPNARVAALILRNLAIPRNKGVANVRRIGTGQYCVRPTVASGVDPATAIVVLTPEFHFSLYNEVTVQWRSTNNGCASNEIGVYTFSDRFLTARYRLSNDVSFSIIVP